MTALLKPERVARTQKLLEAARDYPCAHCGRQDGTIVAAHCNELALGRGAYFKTKDYLVAYLCSICHDQHEGRRGGLSRGERQALWHRAYCVTVSWWWRDNLIEVA